MIKTLVWSVLLYGSESWTLKEEDINKLDSTKIWFCRRMERVSWPARIINKEVLRRIGDKRIID